MSGITLETADSSRWAVTYDEKASFSIDEMEKQVAGAGQRYTWIQDHDNGKTSEWLVDGFVKLIAPSDAERARQKSPWIWKGVQQVKLIKWCQIGSLGGVGFVVGGWTQRSPYFMIVGGFVAMALGAFSIYTSVQNLRVANEIRSWNVSPPERVAQFRTAGYQGHPLRPEFFHPREIQAIYSKRCLTFCRDLLKQHPASTNIKILWINEFFRVQFKNLLTVYAPDPAALADLEKLFCLYLNPIDRLAKSAELQKTTYNLSISYKEQRTQAIRQMVEQDHPQSRDQIHQECEQKIAEANKRCEEHQALLSTDTYIDLYYQAVREFLTRLEKAYQGEPYQPMDMTPFFPWLTWVNPQRS